MSKVLPGSIWNEQIVPLALHSDTRSFRLATIVQPKPVAMPSAMMLAAMWEETTPHWNDDDNRDTR